MDGKRDLHLLGEYSQEVFTEKTWTLEEALTRDGRMDG